MTALQKDSRAIMDRASRARREGRPDEAARLLSDLVAREPQLPAAWNSLGVIHLEQGRFDDAVASVERAVQLDPAPPLWLNLARAHRALGDHSAELNCLEAALERDPYFLPAILAKGAALRGLGRTDEALELYRLLLDGIGDQKNLPREVVAQLEEVRAFVLRHGEQQFAVFVQAIEDVAQHFPATDLRRATAYAEHRAGTRKIYRQQPTGPHFPYLPAIEFFDRGLFPWFDELEAHTPAIRDELLSLWAEEDANFRPYVAFARGAPTGQWTELNHSPRWSAWFFWENGVRNDLNCARCPQTAAVLDQLPLLDAPGKAPTAMFSVLYPHTRIPPHTGTSNTRTTIHLPLVVPPRCGFRVGAETREWREGEAWAFDDTIEHEAWNESDHPRAILILDSWNPLLSEAEREVVRRIG